MSVFKKLFLAAIIMLLLAAAVCTAVVIELKRYAATTRDLGSEEILVTVSSGDSFGTTAARLETAGIIDHPLKFELVARLNGDDQRLKAGQYAFSGKLSPRDVLEILVKGSVKLYRLTVPEGYTVKQIARLVEAAGIGESETFIQKAFDPDLARELGIQAQTVEGYLFPETYFFPSKVGARKIISTMVERFRAVFQQGWESRAAQMGFSTHEIVTLASIIEKETGAAHERELISSVFHNRLKRGMRLEADPTVIYGLEEFDGNLTRKHLETPTAYNTYLIRGLPPGPIANPGKAALKAALFPAESEYIFFVAKKDGTHQFSTNLRDHRAAVRKYQLR